MQKIKLQFKPFFKNLFYKKYFKNYHNSLCRKVYLYFYLLHFLYWKVMHTHLKLIKTHKALELPVNINWSLNLRKTRLTLIFVTVLLFSCIALTGVWQTYLPYHALSICPQISPWNTVIGVQTGGSPKVILISFSFYLRQCGSLTRDRWPEQNN